jgi:hypothetical protein
MGAENLERIAAVMWVVVKQEAVVADRL